MNVNIPGNARLRRMLKGEVTVFPFRAGRGRPDLAVGTVQARIGGKFATNVRLVLPTSGTTLEKVCFVTCLEPAPEKS